MGSNGEGVSIGVGIITAITAPIVATKFGMDALGLEQIIGQTWSTVAEWGGVVATQLFPVTLSFKQYRPLILGEAIIGGGLAAICYELGRTREKYTHNDQQPYNTLTP